MTNPNFEAVVFDVDGTLIDSVDSHARAWVDAFRDFGHEIELATMRRQIGKGGDQLLPVFLSPEEIDRMGEALETHRSALFKARYLGGIVAFPDVRLLFERLIADGRQIALASSAKADELATYQRIANIVGLVDVETSSDDAEKSKPHPDIFQAALKRLGQPNGNRTVVIGDTPYDAEAAASAGLRSIGFLSGGWSEGELRAAGCMAVFASPADLLQRYAESPLRRDEAPSTL